MMLFSLLVPLLAGCSYAAPGKSITATFDDLTVTPGVPTLNSLRSYKGLQYTGFAVNQVGVSGAAQLAGVAAQSKPNNIVSGLEQTAVNGVQASIQSSSSKGFDLHSFAYGCSVNTAEGAESVPQQCTLQILGFKRKTDIKPVANQLLTGFHPPATTVLAQPVTATFGDAFKGVQFVSIVQVESNSGEALNTIVLDNIKYTTH